MKRISPLLLALTLVPCGCAPGRQSLRLSYPSLAAATVPGSAPANLFETSVDTRPQSGTSRDSSLNAPHPSGITSTRTSATARSQRKFRRDNKPHWRLAAGLEASTPRHAQRTGQNIAARPAASSSVRWTSAGLSAGRREIEVCRIGRGPRHLLVVGSMYGNEADSVSIVERLAEHLTIHSAAYADWTILFVRTPNPDGLDENTLTNARGVALNQNFPSSRFAVRRTALTGFAAASEPETRILLGLLDDFRPDRVVHLRNGTGQRPLLLVNEQGADGLRERIDATVMDGGIFESFKNGSLEEFVTESLETDMMLVYLPLDATPWEQRVAQLAAVLIGPAAVADSSNSSLAKTTPASTGEKETTAPPKKSEPEDLFAPYKPPVSLTGEVESLAPRGLKGFVEILPPPPDAASAVPATDTTARAAASDPRYYELPPPG